MPGSDHCGDGPVRPSHMPDPVHLLVFTRGDTRPEAGARRLGEELQAMSRNIRLELYDIDEKPLLAARYGIERTPAFTLLLGGVTIEDARVHFYGLPTGSLRRALIAAIVTVGHSRALRAPFRGLRPGRFCGPVHLQVLVPDDRAVDLHTILRIYRLVATNPRLDADIFDVTQFPDLATRYRVGTAMAVIVNETITSGDGATMHQLLDALAAATAGEPDDLEAERMTLRSMHRPGGNGSL